MRKVLLALSGAALTLTVAPASVQAKNYVCTKWSDGVCVSTHRVKGVAPYAMGYVFGPSYGYSAYSNLPAPVVSYYNLNSTDRYVYNNGYIYVVDPVTYAVTRVIDTLRH